MNLPKTFSTYLKLQGLSSATIRNYLADLNHFLAWLELTLRCQNIALKRCLPEMIIHYFNWNYLTKYKNFLIKNQLPLSTVNRRLSTLRTFGKFCLSQAWISENPAQKISNVAIKQNRNQETESEEILEKFRKHLEEEKNSSNTIKNYLSDIREFLSWSKILGT